MALDDAIDTATNLDEVIIKLQAKPKRKRPGLCLFDKPIYGPKNKPIEFAYQEALSNIKGLSLQKDDHPEVDLHLNALILQVAHLKDQGKVPTTNLITVLEQTYALLTGSLDHNAYQEMAKTMEKDQEPGMAIMGGIMIALGLVLAAALATSLAVSGVGLGVGILCGTVGFASATLLAVAGVGLFAEGISTKTRLSEEMLNVATAKESDPASYSPLASI